MLYKNNLFSFAQGSELVFVDGGRGEITVIMFGVRAVISHPLFSAVHSHHHKFTHSHIMSFFFFFLPSVCETVDRAKVSYQM